MGTTELDDLSGIPRYVQIAHVIEREIRSGKWTPGKQAPSRAQIAQRWGVAKETAAHAHRWLADRGYLVAVAGVGMVVTPRDRWPSEP
jgi:GntR family transcriptional regulator